MRRTAAAVRLRTPTIGISAAVAGRTPVLRRTAIISGTGKPIIDRIEIRTTIIHYRMVEIRKISPIPI